VIVRALAYIWPTAEMVCATLTVDAVMNANYLRKKLDRTTIFPTPAPNMHEVVFSDDRQAKLGVRTGRYRQAAHRLRFFIRIP